MHRSIALVPLILVAPIALSGCGSSGSCTDYVGLGTPQARYDTAPVVVIADVSDTDRTVDEGAIYPLHRAHVEQVLKGRLAATDLDVWAPSDQCTTTGKPATYLEGDPLDHAGRSVLYLERTTGSHPAQLIVPGAVDPLPSGTTLPFSTSSPTASPTAS